MHVMHELFIAHAPVSVFLHLPQLKYHHLKPALLFTKQVRLSCFSVK